MCHWGSPRISRIHRQSEEKDCQRRESKRPEGLCHLSFNSGSRASGPRNSLLFFTGSLSFFGFPLPLRSKVRDRHSRLSLVSGAVTGRNAYLTNAATAAWVL